MIRIRDLWRSFNGEMVLKGITCDIADGGTTVFLGPSGVGKSVLIKHIVGLLRPDRGAIFIDDVDITRLRGAALRRLRKRFGVLFQDGALFDSMTVAENVAFPLRQHTRLGESEIAERVREKLAAVGMSGTEELFPAELSGGMRKRVGLARAIVMDPEIILFDEPTSGLDPLNAAAVCELITSIQRRLKKTFIVISHDIEATLEIANTIGLLEKGRLVAYGSPAEVVRAGHPFLTAFFERHERAMRSLQRNEAES
jgi:phospholipid/cholesterol/gamma-HCH transport system ATP-binding protein